MEEGHLWRLSVTLCLKPAGGLTCHSASSFCRRLHAILLRACTHAPTQTGNTGRSVKSIGDLARGWIGCGRSGEGLGFVTLRDGDEEEDGLAMPRRGCCGGGRGGEERKGI